MNSTPHRSNFTFAYLADGPVAVSDGLRTGTVEAVFEGSPRQQGEVLVRWADGRTVRYLASQFETFRVSLAAR